MNLIEEKIIRFGYFDKDYYLKNYPEVTHSGKTPFEHYMEIGWKEGKNPSPLFHTSWYLQNNPDVANSGVNPLVHYLEWGIFEGRNPVPNFIWNTRIDYPKYIANLLKSFDRQRAMALAVGSEFEYIEMGNILLDLAIQWGKLRKGKMILDVGCGSGRLAYALARSELAEQVHYIGMDIVPELLEYARDRCNRPGWEFLFNNQYKFPLADNSVDLVVFFSVLTHLLEEEGFIFLKEAKRVLKKDGRILCSYLSILDDNHRKMFIERVNSIEQGKDALLLDLYLTPEVFKEYAQMLEMQLIYNDRSRCGQYLCVMEKNQD
ncbi:class I SAM-dependent methyltransferase [Candidatus Methylacidiphilum fumarolicum]|jgi:SAM-dependent methyltransferase|uniref:SAM-dependent methyltransferase n=2 Tax=Candidatus Methylacidiphilum fumarolicum TaxID=591154 RepID=I0JZD3_METFB|nr:class I SAM-dependent methyltransferase [Candidatus Methylacidiphilum fumarolicum]MBW6414754.1 class I SAM-dependent methyltransferase [Candidatus Methylacidiphilum fumarolicum]TFE70110.1 SAM-dependent methyltransferase [Candidatus Methylacidiphilum fumarolicum]TFE74322.1 class I SAM-dependent methyltransferase [Candidatus Methylacidiphilum fumarolicum]TFE75821.1 class I SAM-dependent methyltransferase [Candidatus Methylacidiphilum fumarolicum]TFE75982.1 SAM-dependent methyltransferase [Can